MQHCGFLPTDMADRWIPLKQLLEDGLARGVYTAAVALRGLARGTAVAGRRGPGFSGPRGLTHDA